MFLAPNFFGGEVPEFLDLIYNFVSISDHVAKFGGDWPRELGDYALKKKKHHEHFIRPPVTTVHGRPNKWRAIAATRSSAIAGRPCDAKACQG